MPFDFLRRKKAEPAAPSRDGDGASPGKLVPFDGLTEEWRLVGRMQIEGRLSDALNKREAINAFVILRVGFEPTEELGSELRQHVATKISPIAKPKSLMFTPDLPKTRSGKIMRRLLRDIAQGRQLGDTTTLADSAVVETIRENSFKSED